MTCGCAQFVDKVLLSAAAILLVAATASAQTNEAVVASFGTAYSNPYSGMVADSAGNLYGTMLGGTASQNGAVFELSPNSKGGWTPSILFTFNGTDGSFPYSTMILDSAGNLYGTTYQGGLGLAVCNGGCGVVFELVRPAAGGQWTQNILYAFNGPNDGGSPSGNLLMDKAGNIYGTTRAGGSTGCGGPGCGVVFRLKRPASGGTWTESVLHAFNGTDGSQPNYIIFHNNAIYGTAEQGGTLSAGAVFELSSTNGVWSENTLYSFTNGADGGNPIALISSAVSSDVFVDTIGGGVYNWGTIVRLTPNPSGPWTESLVYTFTGGSDGGSPDSPLLRDGSDNLYGTTYTGGMTSECGSFNPFDGCGVVYKVSTSTDTETVLHAFSDTGTDGIMPANSGVVAGKNGALYGTTEDGGTAKCANYYGITVGCGTVYKVQP